MRDFYKILVIGIVLFITQFAQADEYKVLVIPDNIVTENEIVDSYIYNATSEFFANEVINILNNTDFINSPTVSETRHLFKSSPDYMIPVRNLTNRYRTSYNVDFVTLKKIAQKSNAKYALLLTSSIDSENYILRRTTWDVLNIPGASVIDPAYKISTYATLIDTNNNNILWSNTYYKTISVIENRIITRGPSPQTEQLEKIRDYSRILCPEIAQNVQENVLPPEILAQESKKIYYSIGNFDNNITKKYRHWGKESKKVYNETKENVGQAIDTTKENLEETSQKIITGVNTAKDKVQEQIEKQRAKKQLESKLEVKAEPATQNTGLLNIPFLKNKPINEEGNTQDINYYMEPDLYSVYEGIDIKRTKKNNLYGQYDSTKPELRDYN